MNTPAGFQRQSFEELHREIRRYLAAVDAFRAQGCEPSWLPEDHGKSPVSAVLASSASICA